MKTKTIADLVAKIEACGLELPAKNKPTFYLRAHYQEYLRLAVDSVMAAGSSPAPAPQIAGTSGVRGESGEPENMNMDEDDEEFDRLITPLPSMSPTPARENSLKRDQSDEEAGAGTSKLYLFLARSLLKSLQSGTRSVKRSTIKMRIDIDGLNNGDHR